ncbi:MAG: heavy-metal-associated domain-containing protein [Candidatus Micrarchaeota archaeon]|nr:heavy-metal-associated domain-containing protein [Candidatus Micrarchaeota archaeon]
MAYTCPMHPEVISDKPGRCPKCGMNLVPTDQAAQSSTEPEAKNYDRFVIIISLILLATIAVAIKDFYQGTFLVKNFMTNFMAGFFLVFAGFKLMDIKGFAEGYAMYDLLARRVFQYGYIYPFIELAFGLAFLTSFRIANVTLVEIVVMGFSGLGVIRSMLKKQKIQCACLGTIIKIPLGTVTLLEDFGMVLMGIGLLLI